MRNLVSSALKKPAFRLFAVALLAGTAASCSSDATRFDGIFGSDTLTTASIGRPANQVGGLAPTPSADVTYAANTAPISDLSDPLSQPMPSAPNYANSQPIAANARVSTGSPIQRNELSAPVAAAPAQRAIVPMETASAAPIKNTQTKIRMVNGTDPISTGTVSAKKDAKTQVAALGTKPAKVPLPAEPPKQQAIIPAAPQPEKKKASETATNGNVGTYKVGSGDTLSSIARKNGVSVSALKAANGMTSDVVRAGQELKIPGAKAQAPVVAEKAKPVAADPVKTATAPAAKESVSAATNVEVASVAPAETGIGKYRWPANGAVIAGYGANVDGQRNDGIDISVPEGTAVKAAENGVVIYAGNGLEKLGNTVLIRHSDGTVTVYAHVKKMDVTRGEKVNRGQVIASSGMTGSASRPKLHFEVRKNSAPVNPMTFLE